MLFSVVIPVFNSSRTLNLTLSSVLAQNCASFEVIVVDDGSTDDSAELVRAFNDQRIRLISQPNQGVSSARNTGIRAAQGEWVLFLDSDNWWAPQHLAVLEAYINRTHCSDVIATERRNLPDAQEWQPASLIDHAPADKVDVERIDDIYAFWVQGARLFINSIAVRKSLLLEMEELFPESIQIGEDLDFIFRLADRTPVDLLSTVTVIYRLGRSDSLSKNRYKDASPLFIQRLMARNSTQPGQPGTVFLDHYHAIAARHLAADGRRLTAFRTLMKVHDKVANIKFWWSLIHVLILPSRWISR